jgi:type I restriction enzyme, S subunit
VTYDIAIESLASRIPPRWETLPFRRLATLVDAANADRSAPLLSLASTGVIARREEFEGLGRQMPADETIGRYWLAKPDDLVVNPMWLVGGGIGVSEISGAVSPDYRVYRLGPDLCPRYVHHLLRSQPYRDQYKLYTRAETTFDRRVSKVDFHAMPILVPPLDEQRRIADFLDAETARIDALSESRRAQISVLDELELTRIGEYLYASKKTGPVYAYFDVQLGKMLNAERASGGNQQPYLRNANVQWYEIDTENMATMTFEPDEHLRYGLQPGDLLVCEGGYVGRSAVWDGRIEKCFYQKSLHRVRARTNVPVEWLMYWLRYASATGIFEAEGNLTTIAHLTGEQLAEYRIPIPEDGYQRVTELAAGIATIRETQRNMAAANSLLAERRQALITAAVTGGISA